MTSAVDNEFETLLQQVQAGSEAAAWTLVETYGPHVLRAVRRLVDQRLRRRLDSQDFVQAIWASVFARPQKLLAMRQPEELIAYLAAITRNTVIDEAKRQIEFKKRSMGREEELDGTAEAAAALDPQSRQARPSEIAIARERWERLSRQQPDHYRQIIALRLQGHTCQAIADQLGMSERTIRRVLVNMLHDRVSETSRAKYQRGTLR